MKKNIQSWLFNNNKQVFKVGAAVVFLAASTLTSNAATSGSGWASKPSWAKDGPTSNSSTQRHSDLRSSENLDISPFAPGSNNVALDVGQVFLMGGLAEKYNDSIGFQAHYTYGVSDIFGFDASLGYSNHKDGGLSMATLLTGLRTNLSWFDRVIPYVVFGMGFYQPNERVDPISSISAVLFGLHLGPGIDLQLTRNLFFGASLTFHDIFGTTKFDAKGNAHDLGGTFTSFLLHAGVTF